MELGNMIFGNSRGEHPVDRDSHMDDTLRLLADALGQNFYFVPGFENETFVVRPYYWGDCTCGWDDHENFPGDHHPECYETKLLALKKKHGDPSIIGDTPYTRARTALCKSMGLSHEHGCEMHCTCDYYERYEKWFDEHKFGEMGHADNCPIVLPNFLHKPSGYTIKWYKYALRDAYQNRILSEEEFREIIQQCINSIKA